MISEQLKKSNEVCNEAKFCDVCELLNKIEQTSGASNKLDLLFTAQLKRDTIAKGQSIYPLLRLILPLIDTERGNYGLKQTSIAKAYISALHLDKQTSVDAQRLLHWKDPSKAPYGSVSKIDRIGGEFGTILEDVLKSRVQSEKSQTTLREVNEMLDALSLAIGEKEKIAIIRDQIINYFSANEQKWLVRIIFQDLKIGLKHEQVLGRFYPNALQRFNECTSLKTVCEEEGIVTELKGIQLFVRYSPMLAKGFPKSANSQVSMVENAMKIEQKLQPFIMDLKLDGERMSCHITPDNVMMFTRRGSDYTDNYFPLARMVKESVQPGLSCILDGEVCAWDKISRSTLPFGNNLSIGKIERELFDGLIGENKIKFDELLPLDWDAHLNFVMKYILFDILYVDGPGAIEMISIAKKEGGLRDGPATSAGEVTHYPLSVRRRLLGKVLQRQLPNRIETVPSRLVLSKESNDRMKIIEDYFNDITLAGQEGLVLKMLSSPYVLGEESRSKGYWVKMKPEYGDQTEDLDLIIMGAYYGEGKSMRGQGLSTFLCGVKDEETNEEGKDGDNSKIVKYRTVCKVGTGYSFEELKELRSKLESVAIPWNPNKFPEHYVAWKIWKKDDMPNVFIKPEESFVVQLKCAELVDSYSFSAGLTCRFPRIQRIRYDKSVDDVMTYEDLLSLKSRPRLTTLEAAVPSEAAGPSNEADAEGGQQVWHGMGRGRGKGTKKTARSDLPDEMGSLANKKKKVDNQFSLGNVVKGDEMVSNSLFDSNHINEILANRDETISFCVLGEEFRYESSPNIISRSGLKLFTPRSVDEKIIEIVQEVQADKEYSRDNVISLIRNNGGNLVATPTLSSHVIIAGSRRSFQLNALIESGKYDVIDFRYIMDCVEVNQTLPLRAVYRLAYSDKTQEMMKGQIDIFGDSYSSEIHENELGMILSGMDTIIQSSNKKVPTLMKKSKSKKTNVSSEDSQVLKKNELEAISAEWNGLQAMNWRELLTFRWVHDEERAVGYMKWNCLWSDNIIFYLDMYEDLGNLSGDANAVTTSSNQVTISSISNDIMAALELRIRLYGGKTSKYLDASVTHVVMNPINLDRLTLIQQRLRMLRTLSRDVYSCEKRVVNLLWLEDCVKEGRIIIPDAKLHVILSE